MGSLKIYDSSIPREDILREREELYLAKSTEEKLFALFRLIDLSIKLNGGKPIKVPQGRGLVIKRQ